MADHDETGSTEEQQESVEQETSEAGSGTQGGRSQQKEFFKEELNRLKTSLKKESEKIKAPPKREHYPYVFNTLEPYYNIHTAKYLLDLPDEVRHSYASRNTAIGLCDPWVNHSMDKQPLPKPEPKSVNQEESAEKKSTPRSESKNKKKPAKEGSTRLPKFPVVNVPAEEVSNKDLFYSDVPMLRDELKKKYSMNANEKIDEDYKRTKQDFYRMDLDRLDEYHPSNRNNMRAAYFAYLQNTPGSKKAIYECVKQTEKS